VFHEHVDRPAYPARTCEERQGRSFQDALGNGMMILSRWVHTITNSTAVFRPPASAMGQPRSGKPGLHRRFPPKSNFEEATGFLARRGTIARQKE